TGQTGLRPPSVAKLVNKKLDFRRQRARESPSGDIEVQLQFSAVRPTTRARVMLASGGRTVGTRDVLVSRIRLGISRVLWDGRQPRSQCVGPSPSSVL